MRFCPKCGRQLLENETICPSCKEDVSKVIDASPTIEVNKDLYSAESAKYRNYSICALTLGIIALVLFTTSLFIFGWLSFIGMVCSILGLIFSLKDKNLWKIKTGAIAVCVIGIIYGIVCIILYIIVVQFVISNALNSSSTNAMFLNLFKK